MPAIAGSHALGAGDVVRGGEHVGAWQLAELLAGERIDRGDAIDGVAEHLDAQHRLLVRRVHLDRVAPNPEVAPPERHVVALVLHVDQPAQDVAHVVVDADAQIEQVAPVLLGVAHAVDARHRRDDDHVTTRQQRRRCGVPEPVDLVVDRGVLLDVGVAARDVGLGLVVVVVADEVLDPVVGEELAHLLCELRGQRLVRREDQGRALGLLDGPGDGGRLARAGDAEQRLEPLPLVDALGERRDRGRLVAGGLEVGDDTELRVVEGGVVAGRSGFQQQFIGCHGGAGGRRDGLGHRTILPTEHLFASPIRRSDRRPMRFQRNSRATTSSQPER